MRYRDRIEAGQQLAEQLRLYANRPDVLVLALPPVREQYGQDAVLIGLSTYSGTVTAATISLLACLSNLMRYCTVMRRGLWSHWSGQLLGRGVRCPRPFPQDYDVEDGYGT